MSAVKHTASYTRGPEINELYFIHSQRRWAGFQIYITRWHFYVITPLCTVLPPCLDWHLLWLIDWVSFKQPCTPPLTATPAAASDCKWRPTAAGFSITDNVSPARLCKKDIFARQTSFTALLRTNHHRLTICTSTSRVIGHISISDRSRCVHAEVREGPCLCHLCIRSVP